MKQLAQLAFAVLAAIAVYIFVGVATDAESRRGCIPLCAMRPTYAGANRLAPDFELPEIGGGHIRLSSYRGKTVVLNFWTKTCRPCLEEMPSIADLGKIARGRSDLVLLTITPDDDPKEIRNTLQTLLGEAPGFPVLIDADSKIIGDKFGTKLFPETWIIDPSGIIRARFDGGRDWANPILFDLIDSFRRPISCSVEFELGGPTGPQAAVCEEAGSAG